MKYIVHNLFTLKDEEFRTLRGALARAGTIEADLISDGIHIVAYDLQPKVKQADMKHGRVVYTTWRSDAWIPYLTVVEVPDNG